MVLGKGKSVLFPLQRNLQKFPSVVENANPLEVARGTLACSATGRVGAVSFVEELEKVPAGW
jgi:hypothetical protein